jgi:threonylcarbamoyladenosine tRNA methylthiotransferase MtaB
MLDEIERLSGRGYREIVITGVHLGGYGADLEPPRDLAWLLECIAERRPPVRIRVSSVDPPEVTSRLLDVMSDSSLFCPHLHVPLQSADDGVLERMRRRYTTADATAAIQRIRERLGDDAAVGTDLVTGFPEETEEEFANTSARLRDLALSYVHVFPYSTRASTSAARRWKALPDSQVHDRAVRMREVDAELRRDYRSRFVGRDANVLFEGTRDETTGRWSGYSEHYLTVACEPGEAMAGANLRGTIHRARVESAGGDGLIGRLA